MKRVIRWVALGIAVFLAVSQFVPVDRSNSAVETEVPASAAVRAILRRACYDCHSNETVWPWYSHVAPISWLVAGDVREGRRELNFSAWNRLPMQQQVKKLKESGKEVMEGEMPPWYYVGMHRDAALSVGDRDSLRTWALSTASQPMGRRP